MEIQKLKQMTPEEFQKKFPGESLDILEAVKKAKEGFISIQKISENESPNGIYPGYTKSGYTETFGEGISLHISTATTWFYTSQIKSINWEDHTFKTINSTYKFDFKEYDGKNKEA